MNLATSAPVRASSQEGAVTTGLPAGGAPAMVQPGAPSTVVVLGARGRLGYACAQAFAQAGWRVLAHVRPGSALARHQSQGPVAGGGVRWVDVPLDDAAAWDAMLAAHGGAQVVVNAMATAFTTRAWANEMQQLTQAGIAVARRCEALLLAPLSILAYGNQLPEVLREDDALPTSLYPNTVMGTVRAQTELQLRMAAESGVQVCTLRAGAFYGHTGEGWISGAVTQKLQQGRMAWLGPYDVATPWVYVLDLAQTLERIASRRHQLGVWTRLHSAGRQRTGQDWWQALAQGAQQRGWLHDPADLHAGRLRWALWKPIGWFSPRIRALGTMEYVWRTPHRLDNQRLVALIGPEPCSDWQRSVEQTLTLLFPPADALMAGAEPVARAPVERV